MYFDETRKILDEIMVDAVAQELEARSRFQREVLLPILSPIPKLAWVDGSSPVRPAGEKA